LIPAPANQLDIPKVVRSSPHHPVEGYGIGKGEVIYNPKLNRSFALRMDMLNDRQGNPAFAPRWSSEDQDNPRKQAWRQKTHQRFVTQSQPYQDAAAPMVKLMPLWHGTQRAALKSIFKTGFANLATTDSGFFGNGIYGAHEASYAHRVYAKEGALLLNWVAIGSAYPVIKGDMKKLQGKSNYQNYDAHYIPVVPRDPGNPLESVYYPTRPGQKPTFTELVVFNDQQCLPRYLVTLKKLLPGFQPTPPLPDIENVTPQPLHSDELPPVLPEEEETLAASLQASANQHPLLAQFLEHVAKGNQDQAEALLKKSPELVLGYGNVTDYSKRTFRNITALQYTMWALDVYMFRMILPYFEQIGCAEEANRQSIEWKTASQRYVGKKGFPMKAGEDHFDFTPSKQAYQAYFDNWERLYDKNDGDGFKRLWVKGVGGCQALWPAHYVLEMTTKDRPLYPMPDFEGGIRPAEHGERHVLWFFTEVYGGRLWGGWTIGKGWAGVRSIDVAVRAMMGIEILMCDARRDNKSENYFQDVRAISELTDSRTRTMHGMRSHVANTAAASNIQSPKNA
jgi:hypothetical protein